MESLGADIPGSALAVKSAEALCPDSDSECKMKEVDQTGGEGWLGLVSMAELDLVFFFEWLDWDFDASVVDSEVCFEDCFLLSPPLAPRFLPCGTSLVGVEYLGALESTSTSRLYMAFIWLVKGGFSGKKGFGLSGLSKVIGSSLGVMSGDDDSVLEDDTKALVFFSQY
nr:hypothetical protein [Tanacetum cinerariifolium]